MKRVLYKGTHEQIKGGYCKLIKTLVISVLALVMIISGLFMFLTFHKSNIDSIAEKILKSNPTAVIKEVNPVGDITKPNRILSVTIGEDLIKLYEFKNKASAEKGLTTISDGLPGENFILDSKDNIVVKYTGGNEDIAKQLEKALK